MHPSYPHRNQKAQAALEFLMTYGWAILVVLVVIGALAYFGVLTPSNLTPEKCAFTAGLSCEDFSVLSSGGLTLTLRNTAGRDMSVSKVTASSKALGNGIGNERCDTGSGAAVTLKNGDSSLFYVTSGFCVYLLPTGRDKNKYNITLTYSWMDSPGITHRATGELLAKKP